MTFPKMNPKHTMKEKRTVVLKYLLFVFAMMLSLGAYTALLTLQSSVNIVDAVGLHSTMAAYIAAAVFGIIASPAILRILGIKWALVVSYTLYFLYICANFYPSLYLLTAAGILVGMSESLAWPSSFLYAIHYARRYASVRNQRRNFYDSQFIGSLACLFNVAIAVSYLIVYCILYVRRPGEVSITNNTTLTEINFSVCGPNDCQDPKTTQQNLRQYVPPQVTRYIVYGVLAAIAMMSIVIQGVFVGKPRPELEARVNSHAHDGNDQDYVHTNEMSRVSTINVADAVGIEEFHGQAHSTKELPFSESLSWGASLGKSKAEKIEKQGNFQKAIQAAKDTFRQMLQTKQLLIIPITWYNGMLPAFTYFEMTRAFASCILGVEQIGICMTIYTSVKGAVSFVVGKISAEYGRFAPMLVATMLDLANHFACLFWIPNPSNTWVVYILFAAFGVASGTLVTLTPEVQAAFFPDSQESAMVVYTFWFFAGYALQSGWSASVCVEQKIYFQCALIFISMCLYSIGEFLHRRETRDDNSKSIK